MTTAILLHDKPGKDEYYDPNFPLPVIHIGFPGCNYGLMTTNQEVEGRQATFKKRSSRRP